jgi:tetratricopeptide (TPR) repeat protein
MSNVAKLKKQAAELEQKKQFDKALAVYVKLLESFDQYPDELDVALFNRVGDLMLRQGNTADAVDYYEQAIDRYADTGFFNNAIALCNKILRHSPGRATVYYKLGKISAQKGFKNDAKANFLEYADRMQKAGKVDEAFRALKEFADLCPDQDEIRLMLADQLTRADRKPEAIDQLQTLYERYEAGGRVSEASATLERMRAIDPAAEPRSAITSYKSSSADLVFLDLDSPSRPVTPASAPPAHVAPVAVPAPTSVPVPTPAPTPAPTAPPPLDGVTRVGDDVGHLDKSATSLPGLDEDLARSTPHGSLLDFEPTSLGSMDAVTPLHRSSVPTHSSEETATGGELEFIVPDPEPTHQARSASIEFDLASLTTPTSPPPVRAAPTPRATSPALDGLPLMDLEISVPTQPPRAPRPSQSLEEISFSKDLELIDEVGGDGDRVRNGDDAARAAGDLSTPEAASEFVLLDLNTESLTTDDDEPVVIPTPSIARRSTMVAVESMEILKASVEGEPANWPLRRELGEAMLDAGERDAGIKELESAMTGAERAGDLDLASAIAEEVARLEPELVKHHQKRVEYAFRTNDRSRLIEAYLSLADALLGSDQADKARTVYQRVLDLAPDEIRAQTALEAIVVPEPEPPPIAPSRMSGASNRRTTIAQPAVDVSAPGEEAETFVNLGDWLRDDEVPKDTRMVVAEQEPSGDEDADFADMLRKFKQGVAENVDPEDYQSHYDLAIAYKEMGLLDEAISEFQKALGSPTNRVPTYEALGQCFMEKSQFKLASSILSRALSERASEDQLVGVLYLLGLSAESQGKAEDALGFYQRVFVLDIQFRDIADRLNAVEQAVQ